ncbi:hypothetical protein EG329_013465 [Mollisiaceae sp. DMI_Dod_QoI]|nr:hypothetical protein EG329_013465 [Helotiales sp. DMI_Dod_QoI]
MPRGPTTSKRQQGAANQRDTRHENGLVGPGKRVQKQKSNGHLNGHAKSPDSNSSTPPLPGTPPLSNGHARHPAPGEHTTDPKLVGEVLRRTSLSGYSDSSASEVYQNLPGSAAMQENHRQIDVSAVKNPSVHRDSINLFLTVLQSCPLRDTLAILIVLLQVPPTFLSIVHLLFATLTFVPPSATTTSGLSFTDILQGTLGTPSVGTIFLIDMVVLLVWLFLWSPLQDIALDLAQTVIALTLGGGTSGKEAGTKNVLWCFGVIWISHIVRNGNVKQGGLRAIIGSNLGSPDPDDPLEPSSPNRTKRHGLIRSILAIHILTQGVVRYIRDWYVRRERRDHSASIGDPEAGKTTADASDSTVTTTGAETDTSMSLVQGTVATSKKKKKYSAQVRIRQPLWAALASTKIVMVKEYETSHTAAESAGTNATDMNNLGNAPFNSEADRIWITYVGSDEVYFSTSFFPIHTPQPTEERRSEGVDRTKPFYVRVNRTIWQPTRINVLNDPASPSGQDMRWNGEIFGLAPTSNYQCDFHSTVDDSVIFSTSVRTLQSLTTDLAISPNPQITGRPGSPITTLKTSIATADLKLAEERNRQKRERREQQKKLGALKKEIDRLTSGIASTGGNDDKLKQKAQQSQLHMKQAEDATVTLESQVESLEAVPTDDTSLYTDSKAQIQSERDHHKRLLTEFNAAKQKIERDLQNLKNELTSIQQKCESKQARVSQLNSKHESLTDANAKGLDEVQRKQSEREAKRTQRDNIRRFYNERLQAKLTEINEGSTALAALDSAIEAVQQRIAENEAYMQSPSASNQNLSVGFGSDIIAEGVSSSYPWNPVPATSGSYFTSPYAPMMSLAGPSNSPHGSRTRGRSSSMLSNVSGFTQSDDGNGPGPIGPGKGLVWEDAREERKGSSGSGSGSGSKAGSVSDPRSPVMGNVKIVKR